MGRLPAVLVAVVICMGSVTSAMDPPRYASERRYYEKDNLEQYLASVNDPEETPFTVTLKMDRQTTSNNCEIASLYYFDYEVIKDDFKPDVRRRIVREATFKPKPLKETSITLFPIRGEAPNKENSKTGFGCEEKEDRYYFLTIKCKDSHLFGKYTPVTGYSSMNMKVELVEQLMSREGAVPRLDSVSTCAADDSLPGNIFFMKDKSGTIEEKETGWIVTAEVTSDAFSKKPEFAIDGFWSLLCSTSERAKVLQRSANQLKLLKATPKGPEPRHQLPLIAIAGQLKPDKRYALFESLPNGATKGALVRSLSQDMWLQLADEDSKPLCKKVFVRGRDPGGLTRHVHPDDVVTIAEMDRAIGRLHRHLIDEIPFSFTKEPGESDAIYIRALFWRFVTKYEVPVNDDVLSKASKVCFLEGTNPQLITDLLRVGVEEENVQDRQTLDILIWWSVHCGPSRDVLSARHRGNPGLAISATRAGKHEWAERFIASNDEFCNKLFLIGATHSAASLLEGVLKHAGIRLFNTVMAKLLACNDKALVKEVLNHQDKLGATALSYAVSTPEKLDIVQVITTLLENGADPNIPDRNGCTPMHYAMKIDDRGKASEIGQLILSKMSEKGMMEMCKDNAIVSESGSTVFGVAAKRDDGMLKTLIHHPLFSAVQSSSSKTVLPLMKIIGRPEMADTSLLYINKLAESGSEASLFSADSEGRTLMTRWIAGVKNHVGDADVESRTILLGVLRELFKVTKKAGLLKDIQKKWMTPSNNGMLRDIQLYFGQELADIVCAGGISCKPVEDQKAILRKNRAQDDIAVEGGGDGDAGAVDKRRVSDASTTDDSVDSGLYVRSRLEALPEEEQRARRELAYHLECDVGADVTKVMDLDDEDFAEVCASSCAQMDYWGCDICSRCGCSYCSTTKKCHSPYSLYVGSCSGGSWHKEWKTCSALPHANAAKIPLPKVDYDDCWGF